MFFLSHVKFLSVALLPLLFLNAAIARCPQPQTTATNLGAFYKHGQVFLTWQKIADTDAYYKVYRSSSLITGGNQLPQCEYLGWVNSLSSKDFNLSAHDDSDDYLVIDSGMAPLLSSQGLFVAKTLSNGNYFYAVTVLLGGNENVIIVPGENSLVNSIAETVEEPQPVFQQSRMIDTENVLIYSTFVSMKYESNQPLMNKAGFIANDFAVYLNHATSMRPIRIRFHAGGNDFLNNITVALDSEIVLSPEDYLPNGENLSWWGANENYDIYNSAANLIPPDTGGNYNYGQQRTTLIIDWAIKHLPIDSNRIYLDGSSFGSIGTYFYAITYPEKIAAVKLSVGCFNFAFQNDSDLVCTLNAGNGNRKSGDDRFGTVSTNLITNLGYHTYDMLNGGWVASKFNEKNYPLFYTMNGKYDTIMGWTEKTIYYDSVNATHIGGYYFWDSRNHGGLGATWNDENFDLFRYRRNLSFPAFAYCSTNENFGNGNANDGASFGTVNGFLDWKNEVTDEHSYWAVKIFLRNLEEADGSVYITPAMCTTDISPRRLQNFQPVTGDSLAWDVKHHNQIIQSGKFVYTGGVITVPQIEVYDDSVVFELTDLTTVGINDLSAQANSSLEIFPNPVVQSATISWQLASAEKCTLKIFDLQGRLIRVIDDGEMSAGLHQHIWNSEDESGMKVKPGIYFLRMETATNADTRKLIVIR